MIHQTFKGVRFVGKKTKEHESGRGSKLRERLLRRSSLNPIVSHPLPRLPGVQITRLSSDDKYWKHKVVQN